MDKQHEVDIFKVGRDGLTREEVTAIQSCWAGTATAGQQNMALSIIIDKLSMADHLSFKEGSPDGGAFLAGRAFVGKLVRKALRANVGDIPQ